MKIGTPLSAGATRIMLLGAGELGKEVIIALQRLGVEVIAVDRYANAPGHQVAHHARVIDMADADALRELIAAEQPDIIVPEIEAIATEVLAEVEQAGDCEVIPTARAAQLTMNREGIRRLAAEELGLPTSAYAFADDFDSLSQLADEVGYPCIIKPIMSSSGKGQSRVEDATELRTAWDYAMSGGRVQGGRVIVERVVDFDFEITQLTVRSLDADGASITRFCDPVGHRQVGGDYVESWQPQPMSGLALQRARDIAAKVTAALGGRGIFGVELFVRGDEVIFSEVSPRPHDTGMVTMISQRLTQFDLHARAVLGLPVDVGRTGIGASAVIYGGVEAEGVSFDGLADALSIAQTDLRLFGKPVAFERRRMGVALALGEDIEQARERAAAAAGKVRVSAPAP